MLRGVGDSQLLQSDELRNARVNVRLTLFPTTTILRSVLYFGCEPLINENGPIHRLMFARRFAIRHYPVPVILRKSAWRSQVFWSPAEIEEHTEADRFVDESAFQS